MSAERSRSSQGRHILLELAATGVGEGGLRVAQLLTIVLAAQALGVEALALVGIAWSLTAIALAFVQGGVDLAGMRAVAALDPLDRQSHSTISALTRHKLSLMLLSVPFLFGGLLLTGYSTAEAIAQLAAQTAASILSAMGLTWAFRGLRRPGDVLAVRAVQAVITLLALWGALSLWRHPLSIPLAEAIGAATALVIGRLRLGPVTDDVGLLKKPSQDSLVLGCVALLHTLGWMMPILAAGRMSTAEVTGHMAACLRLFLGISGILQLLYQVLYPIQARLFIIDPEDAKKATVSLILYSAVLSAVLTSILYVLTPVFIPILLGPDFPFAVNLFQDFLILLIPILLASPITYGLMAQGHAHAAAMLAILMAVGMVTASIVMFAGRSPSVPGLWPLHFILWVHFVAALVLGWRYATIDLTDPRSAQLLAPSKLAKVLVRR